MSELFSRNLRGGKNQSAKPEIPQKKRKYVRFAENDIENDPCNVPPPPSRKPLARIRGISGGALRVRTPHKSREVRITRFAPVRGVLNGGNANAKNFPQNENKSIQSENEAPQTPSKVGQVKEEKKIKSPTKTPFSRLGPPQRFHRIDPLEKKDESKKMGNVSVALKLKTAIDLLADQNKNLVGLMAAIETQQEDDKICSSQNNDNPPLTSHFCICDKVKSDENYTDIDVYKGRVKELQEKVTSLEKEKMTMSLEMAPLQGQLRSREETWSSERGNLAARIAQLQTSLSNAEEKAHSLDRERSELMQERSVLNNELRSLRRELAEMETKTKEDVFNKTVAATREAHRIQEECTRATEKAEEYKKKSEEYKAELDLLKQDISQMRASMADFETFQCKIHVAEGQVRDAETKLEVLMREFIATNAALNAVRTEVAEWKGSAKVTESRCRMLENQLQTSLTAGIHSGSFDMKSEDSESAQALVQLVEAGRERIAELEAKLSVAESQRRSMHNQLQDLRGSVRVFVRSRPFLESDCESPPRPGCPGAVRCSSDAVSVTVVPPGNGLNPHSYVFDRVFGPSAGQNEIFEEVDSFVQSALDGYKVCLLSYGQTGSGKTHTMQGSGRGDMRGITPRAVELILSKISELKNSQWDYTLQASFLEIYNEQIRDLLDPSNVEARPDIKKGSGWTTKDCSAAKLMIRRGADGNMEVTGLSRHQIDADDHMAGIAQLEDLMAVAQKARSTARTNMNAQSSRSHTIFTLYLKGVNLDSKTTLRGTLHLVDLAGSERLDRSGAAKDSKLLRETQAINKSLSCLADVFTALGNKSSHTPFRNSKLTFFLQDCLGGEGKALMFVNLSPTMASVQETLCSLRFASQVNQVELGKASRQVTFVRGGR